MFKFYKILFFSSMITGTLISISSYSWFMMWMGLEINLLSMIPLLVNKMNIYSSESAIKYFITQAFASSILLFSIIVSLNMNEFFPQNSFMQSMMLASAFMMKLGAAPFHAWFPEVMDGLSWMNNLVLLTWQKIAPFILLMYLPQIPTFLIFIIIFSSILSGILGLNQISVRKIFAYSSINHISWMLASILNAQMIWIFYFLTYTIISIAIILMLNKFKIFYLQQLFNSLNSTNLAKFMLILNFLSLGGLPPFLGFFPKWLVISNLIQNNLFTLSLILIIFTLITLFFYLRLMFSTILINSKETLIYSSPPLTFSLIFVNMVPLMGLLLCPMILNLV